MVELRERAVIKALMHFLLYVCISQSSARNSLKARKMVHKYLDDEGFALELRFGGCCDYYCVGGRYSGQLTWLRLRTQFPRRLAQFWKKVGTLSDEEHEKKAATLFAKMIPEYSGPSLFNREAGLWGESDDAQIMDQSLYRVLKRGFSNEVKHAVDGERPNVIFTDALDESEWPATPEEAAKYWVVAIDYHD